MSSTIYLLDANVFVEAKNRYYAFDLAPKFWETLNNNEVIYSIDRVKDELKKGKDELADWAVSHFSNSFISTDKEDVTTMYAKIMTWVSEQEQFTSPAIADFAKGADGWLVACAIAEKHVVVTQEVPASDAKNKVKIPNVCQAFDVPYVDTFKMLRELGVRFS